MIYYFEYIHLSFSPVGPVGEKVRLQSRRKKDRICLPNKKKKNRLMMAILAWPNWDYQFVNFTFHYTALTLPILKFSEPNTRAIKRIGPHNMDVINIIICGMLGDWWGHSIKGLMLPSVRFQIEQAVSNISYIYHLSELLNKLGYCASDTPKKVGKVEGK